MEKDDFELVIPACMITDASGQKISDRTRGKAIQLMKILKTRKIPLPRPLPSYSSSNGELEEEMDDENAEPHIYLQWVNISISVYSEHYEFIDNGCNTWRVIEANFNDLVTMIQNSNPIPH